jgi:HSP20 family protein
MSVLRSLFKLARRLRLRSAVAVKAATRCCLTAAGLQYGAVAHISVERRANKEDEARYRQWLEETSGPEAAGECTPAMDVVETSGGIVLVLDLPGVPASALTIGFSQGTLFVAGRKSPRTCAHAQAAFHLAERSFGRFLRAIRLTGAFDAGKATATLSAGELRVVLPRIEERRGLDIRIPVNTA